LKTKNKQRQGPGKGKGPKGRAGGAKGQRLQQFTWQQIKQRERGREEKRGNEKAAQLIAIKRD